MPALTGFGNALFSENTVNATPQLIDADVTFTDAEGDFNGGFLTLSGLLAEDRASVRNEGSGAGQIGLSGSNVTYAGVIIGVLAGGSGATLTITFNAAATSAAIDALIQNLTYANVSDTPTASRSLVLNVTDAAGNSLAGAPAFSARTGAANPFTGLDAGDHSSPAFVDLDGDGDLDAVIGVYNGALLYFENTGTASAPVFTQRTGAANPFDGVDVGYNSTLTFGDLDGDGDLDAVVGEHYGSLRYFQNTGTASTPSFTDRIGAANPFNGVYTGGGSAPTFVDLDGDGDLDAVVGEGNGPLRYFQNTGTASTPAFTERTGAANPFDGVYTGGGSAPTFVDLDGDGDLDAVVGESNGTLRYFQNTGTASAPVFTQRTGAANPFNGVDVGDRSIPTFADLDGDGDLDAVVGESSGTLRYFENTTFRGPAITVTVTAENDAPIATGLPTDVTVVEDVASNLDLSAVTLTDVDTSGAITVVLTASDGTMTATSGGSVTVTNSGTGALTLTGTAANIDAFLNSASAIQYTGALNANGDNAATLTITADDGSGAVTLGVVNIDITAVADPMSLTGFAPSVTFAENTVNATPQLLDADVTFTAPDEAFNGGFLTLSGLLAEDRASVRDEGSGAGQIGLSGTDVSYGGVVIGTLAGGSGATLTITFNAAATSTAIDALIQNLTYANVSNTPTATRSLVLNVTDAAGNSLAGAPAFAERTGAANPFNGVDVGYHSRPTFADLDGDGDLDAVVGEFDGTLMYFENTGTASAPVFTARTGAANPFDGVDVGNNSAPIFADLDGDGDLDAVVGEISGTLLYYENTGTATVPLFAARTGAANPFNGVDVSYYPQITFVDLDRDGDLDAVIGETFGTLLYFENTGTASAAVFTQRTGAANPFNGVDVASISVPAFADFDNDGDLDVVIGEQYGSLRYFENTGTALAAIFTERTGAANPFDGVDVGDWSTPTLADMDGDGDLDVVVGNALGTLLYFENTTVRAPSITVTVTAENDAPTATGLPTDVTVVEDVASNLDLSAMVLTDGNGGVITVVLTASAGTMTAASGGGVTVSDSGTGALTLSGTAAAIDAFLNTASNIQYTGALNANGNDAATVTLTADDGSGAVTLGVVNIDITPVIDPPALTGFAPSVTFAENTVNATPQLLDADVTFTDSDGDFDGGFLTLSGLLAEDTVGVRNQGSDAGQISIDGMGQIYFGGVSIGFQSFGSGVGGLTLTVTFNAGATAAAVEALIENLTYANSSDTPTASRTLVLNVTDAAGNDFGAGDLAFTQRTGAANPLDGFNVGNLSRPALVDIDNDGDLDAVVGAGDGSLAYFENTGSNAAPVFVQRTGAANPFDGIDVGDAAAPAFADLDDDGDLDVVIGENDTVLNYFENIGTASAPIFVQRTGAANPFDGASTAPITAPSFADLDGDGDLDAVVGQFGGSLSYFENTGTALAPVFTQRTGAANPFDGVSNDGIGAASFADIDGDGDLDVVMGTFSGGLNYFENTGTTSVPVFVQRTGNDNPFEGFDVGYNSSPVFADVDGDGDLDIVVGDDEGRLFYFENTTVRGQTITVTVTPEDEVIVGTSVDDVLRGGAGVGIINGGAGNNTVDYSLVASGVRAQLNTNFASNDGDGGTTTFVSIQNLTGSAFDDLLIGDGGANVLRGGLGRDTLLGMAGDDILDGGTGAANQMQGGLGDDRYIVSTLNDTLVEFVGEGIDTVEARVNSFTLGANFENLLFGGMGNFTGTGNGLDNVITGGAGDDVLRGMGGDDTLRGGAGNDTLMGGSGVDTADYSTAADRVTASLTTGYASDDGDGGVDNFASIENLTGSAFNDVLIGNGANNVLIGGAGHDTLSGLNGDDILFGGDGDDILRGGGGVDVLNGGAGIDTADYSLAAAGVRAQLNTNRASNDGDGRSDTFVSIENLTGSAFNDTLIGDGGANVLRGGLGRDVLLGMAGDDILDGGSGAANQMQGGLGDDRYIVSAIGDTIIEFAGEGVDTVDARINSFTLTNHVENLLFGGTGNFTGTGNGLDNVITGGAGNDVFRGMGGNDTIRGGDGTDEVQFRGLAGQYTVTVEGAGYRIIDSVGGRDGSTYVESIELLRFSDNATQILTYGVPGALEPTDKTFGREDFGGPTVSPLIDGPLVQPMADDDFLVSTDFDGPEVMPLVFDDGGIPGGFDPAGDPVILSLILELEANPMISYGPRGPHLNSEEHHEVHRPGLDHWA